MRVQCDSSFVWYFQKEFGNEQLMNFEHRRVSMLYSIVTSKKGSEIVK